MIDMGFLSIMRRWALRDKMPIREIARRTGLSRNTIKKYLRDDAVELRFKAPRHPAAKAAPASPLRRSCAAAWRRDSPKVSASLRAKLAVCAAKRACTSGGRSARFGGVLLMQSSIKY